MIEVIYKEDKQEAKGNEGVFSVPRNIRQIGLIDGNCRIYVEDYVYTFLGRIAGAGKAAGECKAALAVLVGEMKWAEGVTYVFVKGAIWAEHVEAASDHIEFTEEVWKGIYEEQSLYFPNQEIVGWFFSEPELPLKSTEVFNRVHRRHFGGGDKVLMMMEPMEREDAFFRFENNFLLRQSGYYLYYERNPQMQAYMIEKNGGPVTQENQELKDDAVKVFRRMINGKKPEEKEEGKEKGSVFSYAATACLAVAVLAAGVNFYHNYQTLQKGRAETEAVSAPAEKPVATPKAEKEKPPVVTPQAEVPKTQQTEAEVSSEEEQIYREESDVRKAIRRQAAVKEKETSQQNETVEKAEEQPEADKETSATRTTYVIRPGDSLYQISMEKYGNVDHIEEICKRNGLEADEIIYPGQIIVLP